MSFGIKATKEINETADDEIRQAVIDGLYEVGSFVRNIAAEHVPEWDGHLRNSLTYEVDEKDLSVTVFSDLEYAAAREFGIPAGYQNQPPIEEAGLIKWVQNKLGVSKKEAKGVAFVVARKIANKGVREQPYLRPAIEMETDSILEIFARNLGDLLDR